MNFLGFVVESLTLSLALPRDKIMKVRKDSQALLDSPLVTVRQLLSEVTGTYYLYHSSYLCRALPLPPLAKREKQGFSTFSNLPLCYSPFPSGQRGIGLVEGLPGSMEWKSSGSGLSRLSTRDRHLPTIKVGGAFCKCPQGVNDLKGISFPHKLSRTSGWGTCCQGLCERQS